MSGGMIGARASPPRSRTSAASRGRRCMIMWRVT
jgi:hypothetical protein